MNTLSKIDRPRRGARIMTGALLVCLSLLGRPVSAQPAINFQGVLVEDHTNPQTGETIPLTGARTIAVRLWNVAFAGAVDEDLLWARAYRVNLNADGYFSLLIGPPGVEEDAELAADGLTPATEDLQAALERHQPYLGIKVIRNEDGSLSGRDEYYPRRQLLSAPFALYTNFAAKIGRDVVEEEAPARVKYTSGRTASTQETTLDAPTVVVAEVRSFPVRPGALLHVSYSAPLTFDFERLFPLDSINMSFPSPRARVTLDVRANGVSVARVRADQSNTRPEFDLILPEGDEKVRPVFLNWVGFIPPNAAAPDADALVSVDVRLSMADAFTAPLQRRFLVDGQTGQPDRFSTDLGLDRAGNGQEVFTPTFRVRNGDRLIWDGDSAAHQIVFEDEALGNALNFSLSATMDTHTLTITDAQPIGATFRFFCSLHPPNQAQPLPAFTVVSHLDSAAVGDTQAQRLVLREILPEQIFAVPAETME